MSTVIRSYLPRSVKEFHSNRNVQALKDAVRQNCFNGLLCSAELWGGPKVVFKLTSINYSLGRREDVRKSFVRKFLFEKFVRNR